MADINYRLILKILGVLLWLEAASMLIPLGISLGYGENDTMAFLITIVIAIVVGSLFFFQYTNTERKSLGKRDGFMVVALCWVCFSLLGSLPYLLSGAVDNMTDAFFETMSGVTGTGASVINDVEILPHGILFWRSLTQWLGGLGIIDSSRWRYYLCSTAGAACSSSMPNRPELCTISWDLASGKRLNCCGLLTWVLLLFSRYFSA